MTRSGSNTKNAILLGGIIMLAAACGGDRAQPEATNEFKKSVEEPSPQVQQVADRDPQALEIFRERIRIEIYIRENLGVL